MSIKTEQQIFAGFAFINYKGEKLTFGPEASKLIADLEPVTKITMELKEIQDDEPAAPTPTIADNIFRIVKNSKDAVCDGVSDCVSKIPVLQIAEDSYFALTDLYSRIPKLF